MGLTPSVASEHSERVAAYGMRLTLEVEPALTDDPSLEWGFLLHDVDEDVLAPALDLGEGTRAVHHYHERWDGTGTPDGLAGTDIPIGARILAAVHALDELADTSPFDRAIEELRRDAGTRFDPDIVDGIIACEPDLYAIRHPALQPAARDDESDPRRRRTRPAYSLMGCDRTHTPRTADRLLCSSLE